VFVTGADGEVEYFNSRWYEYTGRTFHDSIGEKWALVLHPDDRKRVLSLWNESVKKGKSYETEFRLLHGTKNEYRWYLVRAIPVKDDEGNIQKWFGTCTDIHEQKLTQQALVRSQAQFQSLYDSNIIGVLYCDLDGNIFEANDAFLKMIGYNRDDLVEGRIRWDELTAPEYTDTDNNAISELLKKGVSSPWEKEFICQDGSQTPVIMGMTLLNREKKECVAFVLDITERKKLEQRKDEFIGIASHELKTPLTSIKGYTQILERIISEMGHEKAQLYLNKTTTYINRLNSLIADLLDVSKIQAGKLQMDFSTFHFEDLVQESIETVQHTSSRHNITKKGKIDLKVSGDRQRLEQVFTNLLSNAIKYSPHADQVDIEIQKADGMIIVGVKDYGVGIAPEEQGKLFSRFYRVESTSKKFSGLGIGLYISYEIVTRHGGRMWVKSKEGEGSTFYFSLPIRSNHLMS
jgi:PAS domain S-box-containing protein